VLGESILNDAVGITLFEGFGDFVKANEEITFYKIDVMAAKFAVTFIGSMLVGVGCGILTALILRFVRMGAGDEEEAEEHHGGHFNIAETLLMLGLCYAPFLVATAVTPLSGIVAVLFSGITARHYAHYNLTAHTRDMFLPIVELFATNCETYTFLLVGMGVFSQKGWYSGSLIAWTVVACLVGRACQVYPLAITVNHLSKRARKFTIPEMHICWLAGLRGAIAFMCSLSFPQNAHSQNRPYVISTTIVIVFASMITLGWPTSWFLKVLRVCEAGAGEDRRGSDNRVGSAAQLVRLHSGEADDGLEEPPTPKTGLAAIDLAIMKIVMTPNAVEARRAAHLAARRRHTEIKQRLTLARQSAAAGSANAIEPVSPRGAASGAQRQGASPGMEVEMTETAQPSLRDV